MKLLQNAKVRCGVSGFRVYFLWMTVFLLNAVSSAWSVTTNLFLQSANDYTNIDDVIQIDPTTIPAGQIWYSAFKCGDLLNTATWKVGSKTGWTPSGYIDPTNNLQRGTETNCGCAIQGNRYAVGFYIDSAYVDRTQSINTMRFSSALIQSQRPAIWTLGDDGTIEVSYSGIIKTAVVSNNDAAVYAVLHLNFQDWSGGVASNVHFLTINSKLFDNRASSVTTEGARWFPANNTGMVYTYIGDDTVYSTKCADSSNSTSVVWSSWRTFHYTINEDQFRQAVTAMNNELDRVGGVSFRFSTNLADYKYSSFNFGEEMNRNADGGTITGEAQIGGALKNLTIDFDYTP